MTYHGRIRVAALPDPSAQMFWPKTATSGDPLSFGRKPSLQLKGQIVALNWES